MGVVKMQKLQEVDPEIAALILAEEVRQWSKLRLIPSENYASAAVMAATGSVLTNKYSEGYAGKRYYEGQQYIDAIESLCIERAKHLFGMAHANVQPYSGSVANLAVYMAVLQPGDTVMGMSLPHGGHLTHGWNVSATGKLYRSVQYGVSKDTELLDYDAIFDLAVKERPKMIIAGATAYPRVIDFAAFATIAKEIGAVLVADVAHISGLIVGGAHPSPAGLANIVCTTTHKTLRGPRGGMILCDEPWAKAVDKAVFPGLQGGPHDNTTAALAVALKEAGADSFRAYAHQIVANARTMAERLAEHGFRLVTGGTDNHLVLMDTTTVGAPGKPVAQALDRAGIVTNANTVPFDPRKPFDPSGVRLGTPAVTSRGMKEPEMRQIADWIAGAVQARNDETKLAKLADDVREFCDAFPPPGYPPGYSSGHPVPLI
ncbi:MAG: serine hydroxymethyltransferase [Myxococcales bacterium]|nr:serine hydroxymethyltransferase [Myxococcales bacterium]